MSLKMMWDEKWVPHFTSVVGTKMKPEVLAAYQMSAEVFSAYLGKHEPPDFMTAVREYYRHCFKESLLAELIAIRFKHVGAVLKECHLTPEADFCAIMSELLWFGLTLRDKPRVPGDKNEPLRLPANDEVPDILPFPYDLLAVVRVMADQLADLM